MNTRLRCTYLERHGVIKCLLGVINILTESPDHRGGLARDQELVCTPVNPCIPLLNPLSTLEPSDGSEARNSVAANFPYSTMIL